MDAYLVQEKNRRFAASELGVRFLHMSYKKVLCLLIWVSPNFNLAYRNSDFYLSCPILFRIRKFDYFVYSFFNFVHFQKYFPNLNLLSVGWCLN